MRAPLRIIAATAMVAGVSGMTAATASVGGQASPTQATTSSAASAKTAGATPRGCPVNRVCFYTQRDYGGEVIVIDPANLPGCDTTPAAASIYNATNEPYKFYRGSSCDDRDYLGTLPKGNGWKVLSEPVGSWTNNWG